VVRPKQASDGRSKKCPAINFDIHDNLPKPCLIAKIAKTAYMIFIYSKGICGENNFRCW
jgi:hypothetical protein